LLNAIETSQLQTLVAVAESKSFSRAGERLHVTQSAISQSVKNLEIKTKVKLFHRSGKQILLTQEGERLYSLAHDFLDRLQATVEDIQYDNTSMNGRVRIGTLNGIGRSWVAPEVVGIMRDFPGLTVELILGFNDDLLREFNNYRLDLLILAEESMPLTGKKVELGKERSTLIFPDSDEFNIGSDITLEKFASYPTILFEGADHLYQKWCYRKFGKIPTDINVRYVVNSHGNMLNAVSEGMGVAVIPTHVLKRSHLVDRLKTLGQASEVPSYNFFLAYHHESEEILRIKTVIDRLVSCTNPLSAGH
jgi:DNA-binding transcriptional LysR family regulator